MDWGGGAGQESTHPQTPSRMKGLPSAPPGICSPSAPTHGGQQDTHPPPKPGPPEKIQPLPCQSRQQRPPGFCQTGGKGDGWMKDPQPPAPQEELNHPMCSLGAPPTPATVPRAQGGTGGGGGGAHCPAQGHPSSRVGRKDPFGEHRAGGLHGAGLSTTPSIRSGSGMEILGAAQDPGAAPRAAGDSVQTQGGT